MIYSIDPLKGMVWDQETYVLNKHLDSDAGGPMSIRGLWMCLGKK